LKAHWETFTAADFFTVEVWTLNGFVTFYILFFMELSTRKVYLAGTKPFRCPVKAPNCNAFAERFVKSIKHECLNKMIFFGAGSLQRAIRNYLDHYHRERNHQGLENQIIDPEPTPVDTDEDVRCRERLGGLLRFYYRQAA